MESQRSSLLLISLKVTCIRSQGQNYDSTDSRQFFNCLLHVHTVQSLEFDCMGQDLKWIQHISMGIEITNVLGIIYDKECYTHNNSNCEHCYTCIITCENSKIFHT